ncbi:MAG: Quinone oxidoreductase 1 [Alphaproteobacteria bacterium MarineAlpha2_Bin1]|nr:MAG: Quinone oxidoreductase 1 [Alphaproteobacteria bacterium MarineAlpha2_Bin1]
MIKAIVLEKHGGPDNLLWKDIQDTPPLPQEVKIKQLYTSVNYADINFRNGTYKPPRLPIILGREAVGIVEEKGIAVKNFKVGDRVGYVSQFGGYSEKNNINEELLIPIPNSIPNELAAASLLKGCTAQYLLKQTYNVQEGDTVLIHAAAGGVGLIACQWARHLGATVIGTVSTDEKAKMVKNYGCDFPIVYTKENFVDKVLDITNGKKLPVVYDSVGKLTFLESLKCLDKRGLIVSYGNASGPPDDLDVLELMKHGSLFLTRPTLADYTSDRKELVNTANDLFDVINSGSVKVEINQTYALEDVGGAHKDIEERKTTGSTVLKTNL